jgi:hypothetical protein
LYRRFLLYGFLLTLAIGCILMIFRPAALMDPVLTLGALLISTARDVVVPDFLVFWFFPDGEPHAGLYTTLLVGLVFCWLVLTGVCALLARLLAARRAA